MHVFAAPIGWENAASAEIERELPDSKACAFRPGWIVAEGDFGHRPTPCIAFANQCLPNASPVEADSVREWVAKVGPSIVRNLEGHDDPWRLHVFSIPRPGGTAGPRRCSLIRSGMLDHLRRRQKRLLKTLVQDDVESIADNEALIQVGLTEASRGYASMLPGTERREWRRAVSRFAGGIAEIPEDKTAPSRAFQKLREALLRMGQEIGPAEHCTDLGSSPGGWTYVALQAGARVTAVDRSPLRADLMEHPRLAFVRGNAFAHRPEEPCDWMFCDVAAFPDRIIELLDRWLAGRWCRRFIVTVKFRGVGDYEKVDRLKRLLEIRAADFEIRRLTCNKNEATAFGTAPV